MTSSTETESMPAPIGGQTPRLDWVTPEIKRMAAGSAENGGRAANDGGIFTS